MGKYRMKRVDLRVSFLVRQRVADHEIEAAVGKLRYITGRQVVGAKSLHHNGYRNYETYTMALHLDNSQGTHDHWRAVAREAKRIGKDHHNTKPDGDREPVWTVAQAARFMVADQLKDAMEAQAQASVKAGEGSMMADMLMSAIAEVDWNELADHFLED